MKFEITLNGSPVGATLKSGTLRGGRFAGVYSAYDVTSESLPGVLFETTVGIRGRADVVIAVDGGAATDAPDIQWSEHPDLRFPGRTILVGRVGGRQYLASFRERREVAVEAIVSAVRREVTP